MEVFAPKSRGTGAKSRAREDLARCLPRGRSAPSLKAGYDAAVRGRWVIRWASVLAMTSLCAHAQTTIDLLVLMDDTYRSGGVSALRPDGGVVWHGELTRAQARGETKHLQGPIAGARSLRLEWQRADGRRGRRQHPVTLDEDILVVEGYARFAADAGEPSLAAALIIKPPESLKVTFVDADDSTGLATVEIVNQSREPWDAPEVRVDHWDEGHWVPAAAEQCEDSEERWVMGHWTARVSLASMNCIPRPLGPGRYRRVLRLRRFRDERPGLDEVLHFEQPFSPPPGAPPVVMLPGVHFWQLRQAAWSFTTPQLHVGSARVCACDGLVVGRERYVVTRREGLQGAELCVSPPDGGACEELLSEGIKTGDFPPYFPEK